MFRKPGVLLRIQGLMVFALSLFFFRELGAPWWRFVLLLLPDLFMAWRAARYTNIERHFWLLR